MLRIYVLRVNRNIHSKRSESNQEEIPEED